MVTVLAALIYAWMGRPADAERWADVLDGQLYRDGAWPDDPLVIGWAALLRAFMCRWGIERMRADADEAAHRLAAHGVVTPGPALLQGIAHILSGDLIASDAFFADAVSAAGSTSAHELLAAALSQQSLLAIARGEWSRAESLAGQASTALREAGIEETYVASLVCAARARVAAHHGDVAAARRQLAHAQRLRPALTYAIPHVAVQALVELTRVQLSLADIAGARTLMREIDELLARRPDLGTLVGEAQALRDRLTAERVQPTPGASSLTAAELRVLPLLATHLSFPEIAGELSLSPHTVKSQAISIYRKLGAASRSQAVSRSRELALLEG
jgi:LuxR family maltose regulon positive regulatory protein